MSGSVHGAVVHITHTDTDTREVGYSTEDTVRSNNPEGVYDPRVYTMSGSLQWTARRPRQE